MDHPPFLQSSGSKPPKPQGAGRSVSEPREWEVGGPGQLGEHAEVTTALHLIPGQGCRVSTVATSAFSKETICLALKSEISHVPRLTSLKHHECWPLPAKPL